MSLVHKGTNGKGAKIRIQKQTRTVTTVPLLAFVGESTSISRNGRDIPSKYRASGIFF